MKTRRLFAIASLALLLGTLQAFAAPSFDELDKESAPQDDSDSQNADPADRMRRQVNSARAKMVDDVQDAADRELAEYAKISAEMAARYDKMLQKVAEQREQLRRNVVRQWDVFKESTNKSWVDYNAKADSVSKVDFEKGEVEIETLVPVEEVAPKKKKVASVNDLDETERARLKALAEEKIRKQTAKVIAEKEEGTPVLQDQLQGSDGKPVTERNADKFVKEQVAPKMQVEDKPVVAQDGKPRIKVKVKVAMVPEHLKVRASRFAPQVEAAARRFELDPALIFAVMHTESEFNPKAKSQAGAYGLMQVVPRTAGREAYKYVYKEEKLITPEYLYEPENNIIIGSAYLKMLDKLHFGKLRKAENRMTLDIAAYNCGPGRVRKDIVSKHDVDALEAQQVRELVQKYSPSETKAYVPRVEGRMPLYRGMTPEAP